MTQENLLLEIAWIVKTFQNHDGLTFNEMNEMWVNDKTFSGGVEMTYATFHRHLRDLDKSLGLLITFDHRRRKYYLVNKTPKRGRELLEFLYQASFTTHTLAKLISIPERVSMQRFSLGMHVIDEVVDAIKYNKVVEIDYLAQGSEEIKTHIVQPYGLRMYDSRLYMLGKLREMFIHFELDRIKRLRTTGQVFEIPDDFDVNDFYANFFGVYCDERIPPEKVVIYALDNEHRYLDELPLHHSQKKIGPVEYGERGVHEYTIFVSPTNDFIGKVFSRTDRLVVVKPKHLRQTILKRIENMQKNFKNFEGD